MTITAEKYQEALAEIRNRAAQADLGVKTYCLVYLHCETIPAAVYYIMGMKQLTTKEQNENNADK